LAVVHKLYDAGSWRRFHVSLARYSFHISKEADVGGRGHEAVAILRSAIAERLGHATHKFVEKIIGYS
jgi:hypothetical protein